jgi:DNA-binding protein HU-beta
MNKKELIDTMMKDKNFSNFSKKDAENFLNCFMDTIKKTVKKGDDISLVGFGTFTKVKRNARMGINPSTGASIKIKAKVLPKFRPGKAWKDMM